MNNYCIHYSNIGFSRIIQSDTETLNLFVQGTNINSAYEQAEAHVKLLNRERESNGKSRFTYEGWRCYSDDNSSIYGTWINPTTQKTLNLSNYTY